MRSQLLVSMLILFAPTSLFAAGALELEYLGTTSFPTGYQLNGLEVGGLSGIDYDPQTDQFVAISDNRAEIGPARFYELKIDLSDGWLDDGDVVFGRAIEILDLDGRSFSRGKVDPESIRYSPVPGLLYWTSEGDAEAGIAPFVRIMTRAGKPVAAYTLSDAFIPLKGSGVRKNLALESLTLSYAKDLLITASENALAQDGPEATLEHGSRSRVLALYRSLGFPAAEYIYETEPVATPSNPADAFKTNGLVELLTVSPGQMIALERSFSVGSGITIRLFQVDFSGATNILGLHSIENHQINPLKKSLLLNMNSLGIKLDNIEGISFGPRLKTGEQTLILVSDNNFNADGQKTQFVALKIKKDPNQPPQK